MERSGALGSGAGSTDRSDAGRHGSAHSRRGVLRRLRQRVVQFAAGADAEFAEELAQVPFDRAPGQEQLGADLRVGAAESWPDGCVISASCLSASRATPACPAREAASISSGSAHIEIGSAVMSSLASWAAVSAST